jgi:hypothetical protein
MALLIGFTVLYAAGYDFNKFSSLAIRKTQANKRFF